MIGNIRIQNFKCLREQTFNLTPLTILAGANGSGKSSLIQAILLLQSCYNALPGSQNLTLSNVFSQNIGAVSQLLAQDFIDKPQIYIAVNIDGYFAGFVFYFDGDNKQRLSGKGNIWDIPKASFPSFQYLNAERIGPRLHTGIGESDTLIYPDGRNAAYLVDTADRDEYRISDSLINADEPRKFSYQVEKYVAAIMGDIKLYYDADYDSALIKTMLKTSAAEHSVTMPLTGFGYSYAFPVVTAGLLCSCFPNMSLIVENPEAHLHPGAQSNMGKFLALLAGCGVQVIVETHSEHIIDGARIQLAHEQKTELMRVHFFSYTKKGTSVKQIDVSERGDLTSWPKGFFDQKQTDLRELLQMRLK